MRKGSSTFCTSGSTSAPSTVAVHLRCGWSLGGIQDTYLRYEAAGDQYVGRTVCGLPLDHPNFSLLPPHFLANSADINEVINVCFPGLPENLRYIGEFSLASVIYHVNFLRQNLPATHCIFSNALFTQNYIQKLYPLVKCCRSNEPGVKIRATGIPPHIGIICNLDRVSENLLHVTSVVQETGQKTVDGVIQVLEDHAIGAGTVTFNGLNSAINTCTENSKLMDMVQKIMQTQVISQVPTQQNNNSTNSHQLHLVNGAMRRVPQDFKFPSCSILQLWQLWCLGDSEKKLPPFRLLEAKDMVNRTLQKRLNDVKFLLKKIENKAKILGISLPVQNIMQANDVFFSALKF